MLEHTSNLKRSVILDDDGKRQKICPNDDFHFTKTDIPLKGAVVSWWNMDKNGGYDVMTKHGGCPVVIGSKWITNKWGQI